jgi:hypothetical protein
VDRHPGAVVEHQSCQEQEEQQARERVGEVERVGDRRERLDPTGSNTNQMASPVADARTPNASSTQARGNATRVTATMMMSAAAIAITM